MISVRLQTAVSSGEEPTWPPQLHSAYSNELASA